MQIFAGYFDRSMETQDYLFMRRCIELATNASGYTFPNPLVGCVIVHNGRIIGEGFHQKYGGPHAEVNAINSVKEKDLLPDSTLYVNLEPCVHYGKTPPCTDLIIANHIPRVVVGSNDPNPLVAGKGITKLRAVGCEVTTQVLEQECDQLNIRFMTFHRKHRPYTVLKWAQAADGFIDLPRPENAIGQPARITGDDERVLVHKWRSEEQAIMVGTNTALIDDPVLNVRQWNGAQPLRIVLDRILRLPGSLHLFNGDYPTLVLTEKEHEPTNNVDYAVIPFDSHLVEHILSELHSRKILSVLIEGGTQLLQTFIDAGLWDEARVFTGNQKFGQGVKAPHISLPDQQEIVQLTNSTLQIIKK